MHHLSWFPDLSLPISSLYRDFLAKIREVQIVKYLLIPPTSRNMGVHRHQHSGTHYHNPWFCLCARSPSLYSLCVGGLTYLTQGVGSGSHWSSPSIMSYGFYSMSTQWEVLQRKQSFIGCLG